MYRRHGQKLGIVFLLCDLSVTSLAWFAGYAIRFACFPSPLGKPALASVATALPLVLLLAALAYRIAGLYEIHRLRELPRELGVVCRASGTLFVFLITALFYHRDWYDSRLALALFLAINVLLLAVARRGVWHGVKFLRARGLNYGRALIVGSGRAGRMVAETIERNAWTGLEAVGFVDEPGRQPTLLPRLGSLDELPTLVSEHDIDHVFVALPLAQYDQVPRIYEALSKQFVEVQLVPQIPQLAGMRLEALEIDDVAFLGLRSNPQVGWRRGAKRCMDVALSLTALILLAPLLAVLALAVKRSGPGPVLFRQPRIGLGGRPFNMLKFRSMGVDAEARSGPVWASPGDDRCTPLGRWMRRWSLDELPQLWNVVAGDMSLVGPRPERHVFAEQFQRQLPSYAQRHRVKVGMTGWAQVHGWRGNTSVRRRLECDLYYASNWSLWLDVKILGLTLWCGFRHRHAY